MKLSKNKSVNSVLNGISSIIYTVFNGILSMVVTKIVLENYGSDYNGLNAAATQVINMLLILESGFTIASNVALFAPLQKDDDLRVSGIISTTKRTFIRVGILYFIIGSIVMTVYAFVVSSQLPQTEIIFIMLVSLIPTGVTFLFSTKYQVLLQATQHEYIINLIKTVAYIVGQSLVIIVASRTINRMVLRVVMLLSPVLMVLILCMVGRTLFKQYNMNMKPDYSLIKGTKDLLVQKFVGLVYSTAPSLLMSIRIGTKALSIYVVYTNVTMLLKSIANAMLNAPRMSLGALIAEGDKEKIRKVFNKYELIVFSFASIMVTTYFAMIIPFIKIYTANITDVTYVDPLLAALLGVLFFIECLHIPSGIFITMSGQFKIARQIQVVGLIILGTSILVATTFPSLYTFVISIIVAAVSLSIMEIGYVHYKCICNIDYCIRQIILFGVVSLLLSVAEYFLVPDIRSFTVLVLYAASLMLLNTAVIILAGLVFYREDLYDICGVGINLLKLLKKK